MAMKDYVFTSESVAEGHPDKVADRISDSILDAILTEDKAARVACETLVTTGLALVAGEITTSAWVDIPDIVRSTIRDIGYNDSFQQPFTVYGRVQELAHTAECINHLHNIRCGVVLGHFPSFFS